MANRGTSAKLGNLPINTGYVRKPRRFGNPTSSEYNSHNFTAPEPVNQDAANMINYPGVHELQRKNTRPWPGGIKK